MSIVHTFAGNPLDREDQGRRDPEWLESARANAQTRFLPLLDLDVPVRGEEDIELAWMTGIESDAPTIFLGTRDGVAHFALDITDDAPELPAGSRYEDARGAASFLSTEDAGLVAQARAQFNWHRSHRFCGICGGETVAQRGGQVRRCGACDAQHFPRTDPVVIMVISDGDRCLLGQSQGRLRQSRMYSALAGFIDQGESIEEAVRREVMEEAGIDVGRVVYHSSQPWPFPSSLMIGCHGVANSTDITIDPHEMADVGWMERADVLEALEGRGELRVPGPIAIAHHLIRAWALDEVEC